MSRLEHVLMLLCLLLTMLLLMCFLTGCVNQETKATLFYTNGNCVFFIDGITMAQSSELLRKWQFEECDVAVNTNVN